MSGNEKQTHVMDHFPKMKYRVSDSSNLEQGGVQFSSWLLWITVILELCLFQII